VLTRDYIVCFLKWLFEHPEYMFIYLEGKYNSLKGNTKRVGPVQSEPYHHFIEH
jgi:hypothetical protein